IKVEQAPYGDPARLNPVIRKGRSAYFMQHNLGKHSLCVNLKTERGRDLVRALVPHMDVVVENYSPGVMARMGLSYKELAPLNPRLVMCSISALGQTGPLAHVPGYDYIAQAYAGVTEVMGEPGQAPVMPMAAMGDVSTGVHALAAITCALLHRERTGEGQYIDISLLDSYIHMHDFSLQTYSASQGRFVPTRGGAHHTGLAPCGIFRASQGYITIVAALDHQWKGLTRAMGRPELSDDPRFRTVKDRLKHKHELIDEVERWLQSLPDRDTALAALGRALAVSPYHLARTFKRIRGITPGRYLLATRIRAAQHALAAGSSRSVAATAQAVGFRSVSHFATVFRRITGMTPGAYRAAHRDPAGPPEEERG
ncbi:MAG: CoA transferase, partial [Actinomycetia bacterium]|nr:CoA transferase [Actinomycetes bacterium]